MDCVLDILTYADLQALKSGRRPAPNSSRSTSDAAPGGNNKRYIILTHTGQERCAQLAKGGSRLAFSSMSPFLTRALLAARGCCSPLAAGCVAA